MTEPVVSRIRVWWIPQMPGTPFFYSVPTLEAAAMLCDALAAYDLFQLEYQIKPDYCNAGGISVLDADGEWVDFNSGDEDDVEYAKEILAGESA